MRFYCLLLVITLFFNSNCINCKRANTRHHKNVHTFESKTKSGNKDEVEKFEIAKREQLLKGSFSSLKRHDIAKKAEDKNDDEHAVKTPKNVIEPTNAFNHLSDLLGLKGSFIPSQSKQRWLEDEDSTPNPSENFNNYMKQLQQHSQAKTLESEKGILPLDITPEQAALITSTADHNSQRKKFLQWEKEGGSMDTMHFPSRYIKGERSIEGNGIDSDASKRVSTEEPPSNVKMPHVSRAIKGRGSTSHKENGQVNSSLKDTITLKDIGNKDKKGFLRYLSEQAGPTEESHSPKSELTSHAFLATAFHSTNEQPLTHDMINKLQLDPAWDAMEAKMLLQNSRKAIPMPLPVSKIEREMMPPMGEPIGQAYLPNHGQTNLVSNFHRAAGFMSEPLREDLHPSAYYSHFQPMEQGTPQTLNVGGSLVHAFGDPWKNLKQMTYDHAEDNFPLPSANEQLSAQSMGPSPSAAAAEDSSDSMERVGKPLTKVKAQHVKEKETSKVIESSETEEMKEGKEEDIGVKIRKENEKKKPNPVKGQKSRKQQRNKNRKEETVDEIGKHNSKFKEGKKKKENSHLKEENTGDSDPGSESEGLRENTNEESRMENPLKMMEQKPKLANFESEDDGQGPRFSQQESNYQEKKPSSMTGNKYMASGNNAEQSKAPKNENTGRYITHKFVNFLSDVAQHLNVDKLSIAEQLVKDVEDSKRKKAQNNQLKAKENNAINELLQRLQTKRRRVETGHGIGDKVNAKGAGVGSFRISRKQPTVIKYIWNKGISVLKETR